MCSLKIQTKQVYTNLTFVVSLSARAPIWKQGHEKKLVLFPQRFSGKSFSFLLNASDVNDDDNDDHDNDDVDDDDHDDVDVVKQLNKKWTLFEWKAVIGRGIVSGSFFCQNFFQTSRFRIERVR